MGAVFGRSRGTAISSEHNSSPQVSSPMRVSAPTVGCEVPAVAHEQVPPSKVAGASSWDNNKKVEEARRARVEWLESLRRNCSNEEEFHTARTQPIWTELDSSSCSSSSCSSQGPPSPADLQRISKENQLHFQHLMKEERMDPHGQGYECHQSSEIVHDPHLCDFYVDFQGMLREGQKIGGGGQADIHEAIYYGTVLDRFVLKVFRAECLLSDLQRTWSKDIGRAFRGAVYTDVVRLPHPWEGRDEEFGNYCAIHHGTLLEDGRFAFVLERCWGDLRKWIDLQIVKDKTHQRRPFSHSRTLKIMENIASGMLILHDTGTIHKDLKATNCLLGKVGGHEDFANAVYSQCLVADYESSVEVVGTGFWRAPEILLALKNRDRDNNSIQEVWTKMADVYNYAMTCYEVLTGCIPFEDRAANDYDGVIAGERPPLPDYVHPKIQELVRRCWHLEPFMRPPFYEIVRDVKKMQYT